MAKTTDLDRVKEIAVDFLNMPIQPTDIGIVVSHPFTNTIAGYDGKSFLNTYVLLLQEPNLILFYHQYGTA